MIKHRSALVVFTSIAFGLLTLVACSTAREPASSQQPAVTATGVSTMPAMPPASPTDILPLATSAPLLTWTDTPTPVPSSTRASIPTSTSYPLMATPLSVTETKIIRYVPQVPTEEREGVCDRRSIASPYAWRCRVGSQLFSSCYVADDEATIVCGVTPTGNEPGFKLKLTEPLPHVGAWTPADGLWPSGTVVELEDGTVCFMKAGGTSLVFGSERVNYWCGKWNAEGENVGLLGDLQVGTTWRAEKIVIERDEKGWDIVKSDAVPIRVVWQ
jgi:hypothetical protein